MGDLNNNGLKMCIFIYSVVCANKKNFFDDDEEEAALAVGIRNYIE